ncbi:MAG TPA: DUF3108 domain-containing protein [Rubrivivax sp.]|nr:DUF3108 domain-containing protein [Rubrivivax sp.]
MATAGPTLGASAGDPHPAGLPQIAHHRGLMVSTCFSTLARGLLPAATLAVSLLAAPALALEPVAADYQASYMGFSAKGRLSIEAQGGERWKCTLEITHPVAKLTQTTVFEELEGRLRPLSGSDASLLLVKKVRRQAVYDWASAEARWSGDVKPERAGPVPLQAGDVDGLLMNLVIARDLPAGRPLRYRLVEDGRAKSMDFSVAGTETLVIGGMSRQATVVVSVHGNRQTLVWIVQGLPLPARILQRKDGRDDIDLRMIAWPQPPGG